MSTKDCNCGGAAATLTQDQGSIERPRFFPRQLVTPDDLTLGQEYFRNKLRRLNRYLHGWGVVCGARVVIPQGEKPPAWKVVIQKGFILGPYGDEILLGRDLCFDLRTRCVEAAGGDVCSPVADPLCPDQSLEPRKGGKPYYVAIRYKELPARPVRVQPAGCGCDDTLCEYSRWRDGYEICVLDECPGGKQTPPKLDDIGKQEGIPDCPPCPTQPWVGLAQVTTDDQGKVVKIDNCYCRRMVVSLAPYWWQCKEKAWEAQTPAVTPQQPGGSAPAPGGGVITRPVG